MKEGRLFAIAVVIVIGVELYCCVPLKLCVMFYHPALYSSHTHLFRYFKCSFQCTQFGSEYDMRFLFCACSISYMLNDWSGVDIQKAIQYIQNCKSYDGSISLIPGQEGHGGSTFCGVACLRLMQTIHPIMNASTILPATRKDVQISIMDDDWKRNLVHWCVSRQVGGMQGRPNKVEDTCYSYWIGGTLQLLNSHHLLDREQLKKFVLECQNRAFGGFGKAIGAMPDVMHSFYSLAWLSMNSSICIDDADDFNLGSDLNLKELNVVLGMCRDRATVFRQEEI